MVAKLIQPTDPIEVQQLCVLVYGQPGARKSSLAQTAEEPVTFAFDPGIYRAYGRKAAVLFDSWQDVIEFDASGYKTVVVDTIGMCLDQLAQAIMADNPKARNRMGGLSLPGFGDLKEQFKQWVSQVRGRGQSLVFIAHEKAEKNGEEVYYCPDIVGGSYNTLMNVADMVGYMHFFNGKRVIDFSPTDRWMAKVPPCGWKTLELPDFSKEPDYLARLMAEAKASMGRISAESAELAKLVDHWQQKLDADPTLDDLNAMIAGPELAAIPKGLKPLVWKLFTSYAEKAALHYDAKLKAFGRKAVQVA